MDTYRSKNFAF